MLTDKDLEELRNERHADYVAESTPDAKPLTKGYDLNDYKLEFHPLNDALPSLSGTDHLTVSAIKFTASPDGRVLIRIGGRSFDYSSQITPDSARTIAKALFASAIAIEDFEAAECIAQEKQAADIECTEIARNIAGFNWPELRPALSNDRSWVTPLQGVEVRA